jgi:hypothetical protein
MLRWSQMTFFPDAMPPATVPAFRPRNPTRRVCSEGDAPAGGWSDVETHFTDVKLDHYPLAPGMQGRFLSPGIQVRAGELRNKHGNGGRSIQLDRCHALDSGGDTVCAYSPRPAA